MQNYQKIPGQGKRFFGPVAICSSRLFLAGDHLLNVDQYGLLFVFGERYRRFYFKDISGFTARETPAAKRLTLLWSILLLLVLLLSLIFNSYLHWTPASVAISALLLLPCAFLLGLNLWRGPTCQVQIHTAVQSEILPSINRSARLHQFLALVTPKIAAAQGVAGADEIASLFRLPADEPAPPRVPPDPALGRSLGFLALSATFLLQAAATAFLFFRPSNLLGGIALLLALIASVIWSAAMIQTSRVRVQASLRHFGWFSLAFISILYLSLMIYYSVQSTVNPNLAYNTSEWLRLLGERPVRESSFLIFYNSFVLAGASLLGLAGLWIQRPGPSPRA